MKIVKDIFSLKGKISSSGVTIGNFDGVHFGHQKLLKLLKEKTQKKGYPSIIITFDPHPLKILSGSPPPVITPLEQKIELLAKFKPDYLVILKFDRKLANIEADKFITDYLVNLLKIKLIVVGYDYKFGKQGKGDFDLLNSFGKKYGFEVFKVDPVYVDEELVSSTKIRSLVQNGEVEKVKKFLGRFYEIRGFVKEGHKRGGPILGIPTANINLVDELYPKVGVYAVFVILNDKRWQGVANVGYNPTFGENPISVEVHIIDFSKNIYGEKIRVQFVKRLRDEKKFSTIEELKTQIQKDIERAKKELKNFYAT